MKKYFVLILLAAAISQVKAQNPNLGTSGAQFLEIPVGAKAAALGGAFVGLSDDASSVFWNPSGIAKIKSNAVQFSYMRWFEMFDFKNLGDMTKIASQAKELQREQQRGEEEKMQILLKISQQLDEVLKELRKKN